MSLLLLLNQPTLAPSLGYWGILGTLNIPSTTSVFTEKTTINHRVEMTSGTSWSEVTSGTGTAIVYGAGVVPVTSVLGIYRLTDPKSGYIGRSSTEIFMDFDTSPIPDSASITNVILKIGYVGSYIHQDFPSILSDEIEVYAYDFGTSADGVDFRNKSWLTSATKVASIAAPTSGTSSILTLTSNGSNFINAINKTGSTRLVVTTKQFRTKTSESFDFQYSYYIARNAVGAGLEVTY